MTDFIKGMLYVLKGMSCVFHKGLRRFVLLPILFNFLVFFTIFYLIYHYLLPFFHQYIAMLPSWLGFLSGLLLIVIWLGFFIMFIALFTVLFSMAAAPFNGLLAEKAQNLFCQSRIPSLPLKEIA